MIEISDATLQFDRDVKVPLYARSGIPEAWVVDLKESRVHFYRALVQGNYTNVTSQANPGVTQMPSVSAASVDLTGLLTV